MAERSFLAVLVYPEHGRGEYSLRVPVMSDRPPGLLRTAATFEGIQAVDVFRLADAGPWPAAAAYLYEQTVPGTIRDGATVEQVALPDD